MPFGDYGRYLGGLDLIVAVLLSIFGVLVALGVYRFVQAALDDVLAALPHLGERIGDANRNRHRAFGPEWVCVECRSINSPNAVWCYRGCGSRFRYEDFRVDLRAPLTDDLDSARRPF
jgi:hypothetical protein